MKLLITIVQDKDAIRLMDCLSKEGFQFTKVSSTGGFLREGNTTLLIGVKELEVNRILSLIKGTCHAREHHIETPFASVGETGFFPSTKLTVGGAVIFVLDVERVESF